jgi:hypothetical protein
MQQPEDPLEALPSSVDGVHWVLPGGVALGGLVFHDRWRVVSISHGSDFYYAVAASDISKGSSRAARQCLRWVRAADKIQADPLVYCRCDTLMNAEGGKAYVRKGGADLPWLVQSNGAEIAIPAPVFAPPWGIFVARDPDSGLLFGTQTDLGALDATASQLGAIVSIRWEALGHKLPPSRKWLPYCRFVPAHGAWLWLLDPDNSGESILGPIGRDAGRLVYTITDPVRQLTYCTGADLSDAAFLKMTLFERVNITWCELTEGMPFYRRVKAGGQGQWFFYDRVRVDAGGAPCGPYPIDASEVEFKNAQISARDPVRRACSSGAPPGDAPVDSRSGPGPAECLALLCRQEGEPPWGADL